MEKRVNAFELLITAWPDFDTGRPISLIFFNSERHLWRGYTPSVNPCLYSSFLNYEFKKRETEEELFGK